MPTKDEFRQMQERALLRQNPARRAALESERRAQSFVSLKMEDLLADDAWGVYRKHLQVILVEYQGLLAAATERVLEEVKDEALWQAKMDRAKWQGVVTGLTLALTTPDALKAQAAVIEAKIAGQLDTDRSL